jgi:uncharacterized protein involved in outer membrane biogenesis
MRQRKHRILMWTAIFSLFMIIIIIGAAAFVATLDWNRAKPYVTAAVSKATGRTFAIDGDLRVDFGWISRVQASGMRFENASWSKHPEMAEVGLLDVQLNVQELFKWRFVFPSVNISGLKVFLEKNREGQGNWELGGPSAEDAVPEKRTEFPLIEKLVINDSTLQFDNQGTNAQLEVKLTRAEAEGFWEQPVKLEADGYYQKQPMKLSLDGGSYQSLRQPKEPYPLKIQLAAGKLQANIKGNLIEPLAMKGEDVTLDLQGDDLANLYPLLRLVFPSTPPYRLKGRLIHEGDVWSFSNFSGRVGGSDLSGNIRVDLGPTPHVMKADLVSSMLDFKDLAGFVGGDPKNGKSENDSTKQSKAANPEENDRIFPDQRIDLEKLRTMDADVRLRARKILAPNLPIDDLNGRMTLSDGVLSFTPATFGAANGRIEIYSTFDGSKQLPSVNIDTRFRQLDLKRFLGNSSFAEKTLGPIGGRIRLSGTGDSFRQLMATSSGNSFLIMSGGEISEMLLELAGLDVAGAVKVLVRGDKPVPIRCGLLDLQGKDGQMGVQGLVFDSGNTVIFGEGNIDLRDEKVNIVLTPVPKDFSPFSLRSFIRVNGRFKNISVFPDPIKTGTESLLAKVFNVFMMLAMSPLQPRDLATGRDVNCDALIAQVQEKDPHAVVPLRQMAAAPSPRSYQRRENEVDKSDDEADHIRE